jgi:hypothetical protein
VTATLSHRALVESLVGHFASRQRPPLVFTEVALEGSYGSHGRLDVVTLTIGRNCTHFPLYGYEVKATRSDLLHDLAGRKWERYLGPLHRLHFAFPTGLAGLDEIPAPCGVLLLGVNGWRHARAARDLDGHGTGPRTDTWLRLLLRMHGQLQAERLRETRSDRLARLALTEQDHKLASELSARFKKALAELQSARGDLDWRERQVRELEAAAKDAPAVLDALGVILEQAATAMHGPLGYVPNGRRATQARQRILDLADSLQPDRRQVGRL